MPHPDWIAATLLISTIACVGEQPMDKPAPPAATPSAVISQATEIPFLAIEKRMEQMKVQLAVLQMMMDAELELLPSPVGEPTSDMSAFPDPKWPLFQVPAENGSPAQNYMRTQRTQCTYVATARGIVSQVSC